jgi:NADH-quinone oxidoreductase subunit L
MLNLLWLVPVCPLLGFLALFGSEGRLPKYLIPWIGAGSVGLAALLAAGIGIEFLAQNPDQPLYRQMLWHWIAVSDFQVDFALYLDALSLIMMFVVTGVGFLIHVYSIGYMADDPGYSRFFACMNLFIFAMLVLVLADNLVLLYLGWEGVGLCSYLLIGFWYDKPENGYAARKAFIVTRVGDTAMALGLFLLFTQLGSLDIQIAMTKAAAAWLPGSGYAVAASLLLLGGALGKSAQLPLQVWLPDAMAGPTPISALIHAATMVTAGVYLIARTHALFALAPDVQFVIAAIGASTLLLAGFSALTQTDIKRILAYSTISQIGYMFLALGVGAWSAAIFHLMTHAFFKALLFLAAGAVILSLHHEQNIFKMGGLWKRLPIAFWSFLIGAAALVALPFTSGYYSKHEILLDVFAASAHGPWLWGAGVAGALLTALYSTRLILVAFFGQEREQQVHEDLPLTITIPLALLSLLALFGGWMKMPLVPAIPEIEYPEPESLIVWITLLVPWSGVLIAYFCYGNGADLIKRLFANPVATGLQRFCFNGFGFDALYDRLLVQPFLWLAAANKRDVIDSFYRDIVALILSCHRVLARTQNGRLRWYAAVMVCGTVAGLTLGIWL